MKKIIDHDRRIVERAFDGINLQKAFSENEEIIWKQSSNIAVGDVVCLYVTAPVSAVLYRCEATEVNIPYHYDDGNVHMNHVMKLKKLEQYAPSFLLFEKLKAYGIGAVRDHGECLTV